MGKYKMAKGSVSILKSLIHHQSTDGLVRPVGSGRWRWRRVQCLRWAARLKHTWCELPGLCNQRRALSRARSHGSKIMTGDKLETYHLGLKLALGLLYPSVRLSLEAPGLPLSTAERSTSGVKPNLDTWCVPAEFALCLWNSSLCVSRMKTGLLYKLQHFEEEHHKFMCFIWRTGFAHSPFKTNSGNYYFLAFSDMCNF